MILSNHLTSGNFGIKLLFLGDLITGFLQLTEGIPLNMCLSSQEVKYRLEKETSPHVMTTAPISD